MTIREALPSDLAVIVELNARLAHETEGKQLDRSVLTRGVAAALGHRDQLAYWVAEAETTTADPADPSARWVVGQAAVTREWSDWRAGWIWWFQSVYVHPDFRGQGVFRQLYTQIRSLAQTSPDVIGLRLYVEGHNEPAQRVYQSLGMVPSGYSVFEEIWSAPAPAAAAAAEPTAD